MDKKLQIGDVISFIDTDGNETEPIYTILDIDTSRPVQNANGQHFYSHFRIQWKEGDITYKTWSGNWDKINEKLNKGEIICKK
jgi:hypothetical protein